VKGLSHKPDPDPSLITRARAGDTEALRALLAAVDPTVRQWALAHTGDPEEAADLTQEVLILLLRKISSYRGEARFLTWLFSVTRNQALEAMRRKGRQEVKMDRLATEAAGNPRPTRAIEEEVDRRNLRTLISTFVEDLPRRQREVFQMSELQGLSSPEIGKILKMDPGSVRAALFKARKTLRRQILQQHPEFVEEYLP
jgi:RNA polymerase sigma-70 factor (ECF subfamily)